MKDIDRRSALSLGVAATSAFVMTESATAQTPNAPTGREVAPGVRRVDYGKRQSMLSGYKNILLRDQIYQPGSETKNPVMANDMVCHCLEGELQINQGPGMDFIAKKGDAWACTKGIPENTKNSGTTVGIMRVIDLLPT
jgi:hypothetical protein